MEQHIRLEIWVGGKNLLLGKLIKLEEPKVTFIFDAIIVFTKVSCTRIIIWRDDHYFRHLWNIQASSRVGYISGAYEIGNKDIEPS